MSDQLNIAEAEERARTAIRAARRGFQTSGREHARDFLALAALYREAVEALESLHKSIPHHEHDDNLTEPVSAAEAVLAKARAALQEDPAPDNEKALLDGGGSLTEAARAIKVLLAFRDIHEDEKIGLRKAAWLLGIALGREKEQPKP